MRHMEPYFGETDKCQCGFKKNEVSLQKCLTLNITHINKKTNISIINLVFFYFSGQESVSCNESTILLWNYQQWRKYIREQSKEVGQGIPW